jgi:hypothetical protein
MVSYARIRILRRPEGSNQPDLHGLHPEQPEFFQLLFLDFNDASIA